MLFATVSKTLITVFAMCLKKIRTYYLLSSILNDAYPFQALLVSIWLRIVNCTITSDCV